MKTLIHGAADVISDPEEALSFLKEGNKRFVEGVMIHRQNSETEWDALQEGQHPYAAILGCSDSRVSPSVIFDQKNGDIFTVRNAGNIADTVSMGSLEYAVKYLQVPVVVVLGHSNCGAVNAVFDNVEGLPENLNTSLESIVHSIEGEDDIRSAEIAHAKQMAKKIRENKLVKEEGTQVVVAYYNISTGVVEWLAD